MPEHQYALYQIALWMLHWQMQNIRNWAPYVDPIAETGGVPRWWHYFYTDWDWWTGMGPGYVPRSHLVGMAVRGTWQLLGLWVEEIGDWAVSKAESNVRKWTGFASSDYVTFGGWIWSIVLYLGDVVLSFADTIAEGVVWLYDRLPVDIQDLTVTWYDKFVAWYEASQSWVQTNYDAAKASATLAYNWVADTGSTLSSWYSGAHTWLDDFRDNASARVVGYLGTAWTWLTDFRDNYYARVTGWLGSSWSKLVAFCGGALTFFYNLWGWYAPEIGAFWADPLMWLYDRVEAELVRRW